MDLSMGMCCEMKLEMKQKQVMHKKCKKCGEINDISAWMKEYGDMYQEGSAVPICTHCKFPLFKLAKHQKVIIPDN